MPCPRSLPEPAWTGLSNKCRPGKQHCEKPGASKEPWEPSLFEWTPSVPRSTRREGLWTRKESHPTWTSEISCPSDERGEKSKRPLDLVWRETPLSPPSEAESPDPPFGNVRNDLNGLRTSDWWLGESLHRFCSQERWCWHTGPLQEEQVLCPLSASPGLRNWPGHSTFRWTLAETAPSIKQVSGAILPDSRSSSHWGPKGLMSPLPSFPEKRKPGPPPCPVPGYSSTPTPQTLLELSSWGTPPVKKKKE